MQDRVHPATRDVLSARAPDVALARAHALASGPPSDWDVGEWLTIAVGVNSNSDPGWLAVRAFAYEHSDARSAPVDALRARVHLIVALGDLDADPYRSLSKFVRRAEAFVGTDTPDQALADYRRSRGTIFTMAQGEPEWLRARDVFLRCRMLREFGRVLQMLDEAEVQLPGHLVGWVEWASLDEDDFAIETG